MVATFDPSLTEVRDRIRAILGDMGNPIPTDPGRLVILGSLRSDEFYDAAIADQTDWRLAGAFVARSLASQYAQQPDSVNVVGDISVSWRERVKNWTAQADRWEAAVAIEVAGATGGGFVSLKPEREECESYGEYRAPAYGGRWWG